VTHTIEQGIELLREAKAILAFTGAGISTESGIPDFRGPDGVWTKVDPAEFTYDRYVTRRETRVASWQMRFGAGILDARPNPAHRALADLWRAGRLIGCVTQNIDGLHAAAGLPAEAVVEVHGNARTTRCLDCGRSWPTTEIAARVHGGDEDPHCQKCGGILKVTVISFGEAMPVHEMDRAFAMAAEADAVLAVGSTLSVYPAAYVPLEARDRGVPYLIVNKGRTEHDRIADVKVEAAAGEALPRLAAALLES
jgi:NAD-dependent deacetylase